jgi:hypothetical protein
MPTSRDALANARVPVTRAAKGTPARAKAAPGSEPKAPLADISQRNKENQVPSPMTPAKIRDSRSSTSRPSFYASRSSDGERPPLSVHSRFGLLCFTAPVQPLCVLCFTAPVFGRLCGVQCAVYGARPSVLSCMCGAEHRRLAHAVLWHAARSRACMQFGSGGCCTACNALPIH